MAEMRKITVEAPAATLEAAMEFTGAGVSETVRQALEVLARRRALERLRSMRGKLDLKIDIDALREDRKLDW